MSHVLIRNGTVIDGVSDTPIAHGAVLVEGERVRSVAREEDVARPDGPIVEVDAGGGYILPGFIDCHVHLMFEGVDMLRTMNTPFSLPFYQAIQHMRRTLDAGVTTVRDAGGADLGVKRAVELGLVAGPRIQISVTALCITGGHGDGWMSSGNEYFMLTPHPGRPAARCDGPEDVRRKVREVLRAGAEVIKVSTTGGILSTTSHSAFTQFSPEELRVIVEEGRFRRRTRVMAHAHGVDGVKNAIRAGVQSIEHGIELDDEAIELMLERRTYFVPTLLAMASLLAASEQTGTVPEWAARKVREAVDVHRASTMRAYRAGVRIAMGTDAAATPHGSNLGELALLCGIGMTPMEAIVASTRRAAECLGWEDRVGSLQPGKYADLVVAAADPLRNIAALADPDTITVVMQGGKILKDRRGLTGQPSLPHGSSRTPGPRAGA